jgi:hypothetical protein
LSNCRHHSAASSDVDPRKDGGVSDFGSLSAMSRSLSDSELGVLGGLAELDDDEVGNSGRGECSSTGDDGNNDFGSKPDDGERGLGDLGVVRIGDTRVLLFCR